MYLSKTEDCQFIEIKSDTISDFILNPKNYTSFTITAKLNCCGDEEITHTLGEDEIDSSVFTLQFPTNANVFLDQLVFENIFTHQQFLIPIETTAATYMCSTGDITNLFTNIMCHLRVNLYQIEYTKS
jgi:uncharacterized protein YegJ (DUF2314 family)